MSFQFLKCFFSFLHSFSAEETRLNPVEINPLKLCKFTKLDDIVAIGIQCPTVCLGSTEIMENLICSIEVQTDYKYLPDQPAKRTSNQFTCTVKSGQFTEVSIHPPAELRYKPNSLVHIMVKVQNLAVFSRLPVNSSSTVHY